MKSVSGEESNLRILIVDDHFVVRAGLRFILENEPGFVLVGEAADGATAVRLAGELKPDLVLMDLHMPGMDGLEAMEQIHSCWPTIAVVILTTCDDDELMLKGLRAGAAGYLLKDVHCEALFHALRAAARGETLLASERLQKLLKNPSSLSLRANSGEKSARSLTPRERTILEAVARGERNKEIAARLRISEPTVKSHLVSLYAKLGVDSRAAAVAVAIEQGVLSLVNKTGVRSLV